MAELRPPGPVPLTIGVSATVGYFVPHLVFVRAPPRTVLETQPDSLGLLAMSIELAWLSLVCRCLASGSDCSAAWSLQIESQMVHR